ncbi:ImmA/IrrE family metallo-endopeptidase [Serratia fonticola]|uniref:ImmA/IrrE family metallo-endopeptidase n=1 Tax=Serratia fonticola TaxID=47917 RepID=UPI001C4633F7|nr:ImmA/IrrE family metallo-endopeptidase [Serratia fonticola]QXN64144.1 ImmA/IrrE family metallo-endopeptidase [Serratia fonticola]
MAVVEFQLSKTMIDWIANAEGVTTHALAGLLMPKKQEKFLNGTVTKGAAEKLARMGGIPFGYLFLDTPPKAREIDIPDLRQAPDSIALSKDFIDTYEDVKYKLEWYKDHLQEFGVDNKKDFIGRFTVRSEVIDVAENIATTIGFDLKTILPTVSKESYFSAASAIIERAGILVFKNGIVKSNTKRPLNTNEFRGFCIIDPVVPAVFINGSDAFAAQTFTLFHEVAHLWVGKGGVSNWDFDNKIESFCNKVAAEILMPTDHFIDKWEREINNGMDEVNANDSVSRFFKVSTYASAIKAKSLGLIDNNSFLFIKGISSKAKKENKNGANPYAVYPHRNSPKITDAILSSAITRSLPLREAANMLNIKTNTVMELYKKRNAK